jgi:hypothetical protein
METPSRCLDRQGQFRNQEIPMDFAVKTSTAMLLALDGFEEEM